MSYLSVLEAQGKLVAFSVPNEGKRSWAMAKAMKRAGLKRGVSDIVIVLPGPNIAFLELKSQKGRVTPAQVDFMGAVSVLGCHTCIARSFEDAKRAIDALVRAYPQTKRAA